MGARCLRPGQRGRWRGARGRQQGRDCAFEPPADLRRCLACGEVMLALGHPALGAIGARLCVGCRSSVR